MVAMLLRVFMYAPTLVELPVAHMFPDLGMHPGLLLANLMIGPKLNGKPPESAPSA